MIINPDLSDLDHARLRINTYSVLMRINNEVKCLKNELILLHFNFEV